MSINLKTLLAEARGFLDEAKVDDPIKETLKRAKHFVSNALNPTALGPLKAGFDARIQFLESEIAAIENEFKKEAEAKAISEARILHKKEVDKVFSEEFNDNDVMFSHFSENSQIENLQKLRDLHKIYVTELAEIKQLMQIQSCM